VDFDLGPPNPLNHVPPVRQTLRLMHYLSERFVAVPYAFGSGLDYRPVVVDREIRTFAGAPPFVPEVVIATDQ